MGDNGVANKLFIPFLFSDPEDGVEFLKDMGLIPSSMVCCKCGSQMSGCFNTNRRDDYRWRCLSITSAYACSDSTPIRHGSWCQQCNLNFMEVLFLTYGVVRLVPTHTVQQEHQFCSATITDWAKLCQGAMLGYVLCVSQKIGGPNKTVEIDDSKFGRCKYNRGNAVKGQWVFGDVERDPGKTFLVPIPDRTVYTLMGVLLDQIEPGITVTSDCCSAYRDIETYNYTHQTVNHTIGFVDVLTGLIRKRSRARGGMSRHSSSRTTTWGTISITCPTTCMRWDSNSTTWTNSPRSTASLQPLPRAPHLASIAVIPLRNSLSPHSIQQSGHQAKPSQSSN